jgi:hypothetical protein
VRKALMGHSSGEEVNSLYTHVELPVKREAIRKLEAWVEAQRKNVQTETEGEPHEATEAIQRGGPARGDSHGLSAASAGGPDKAQ